MTPGSSNIPPLVSVPLPTRMARNILLPCRLESRGGATSGPYFDACILGESLRVSCLSGLSTLVFLGRPEPSTPKEHQASTSEEDCSYLANLVNEALEEELSNLVYYTLQASTIMVNGWLDH